MPVCQMGSGARPPGVQGQWVSRAQGVHELPVWLHGSVTACRRVRRDRSSLTAPRPLAGPNPHARASAGARRQSRSPLGAPHAACPALPAPSSNGARAAPAAPTAAAAPSPPAAGPTAAEVLPRARAAVGRVLASCPGCLAAKRAGQRVQAQATPRRLSPGLHGAGARPTAAGCLDAVGAEDYLVQPYPSPDACPTRRFCVLCARTRRTATETCCPGCARSRPPGWPMRRCRPFATPPTRRRPTR